VRDVLWPRATTIIWLNLPFRVVFYRALNRTIHRVVTKQRLHSDNIETFGHAFFSRESIPWWVLTTFHAKRRRYREKLAALRQQGLDVIELRSRQQVAQYLQRTDY